MTEEDVLEKIKEVKEACAQLSPHMPNKLSQEQISIMIAWLLDSYRLGPTVALSVLGSAYNLYIEHQELEKQFASEPKH